MCGKWCIGWQTYISCTYWYIVEYGLSSRECLKYIQICNKYRVHIFIDAQTCVHIQTLHTIIRTPYIRIYPHPKYLGSCQRDSMRRLRVLIPTPFSPSHTLRTTLHTTIRTPYIHIFFSYPTYLGIYRCDALRCLCVRILTSLSYSPTHYIPKLIPQFANPTSKFVFLHPTYLCVVVSMTA